MIIESQEKNRIVNFNNVLQIYVTFNEDDDYVWIRYEDINNSYEDLGRYKTLSRAKEIIQEIIGFYIRNENKNKVYRMPKE